MKQVRLNPTINRMVEEISKKRKDNDALNSTKQAIISELVIKQYKKEIENA